MIRFLWQPDISVHTAHSVGEYFSVQLNNDGEEVGMEDERTLLDENGLLLMLDVEPLQLEAIIAVGNGSRDL